MSQSGRATVTDTRNGRRYGVRGTWLGEGLCFEGGFVVVSSESGETLRIPIEHTKVIDARPHRRSQPELHDDRPAPASPPGPASAVPRSGFFDNCRRSIECTNGHVPVRMLQLDFEFVGRWHQCPVCLVRRFATETAVLDEASAAQAVRSEQERLERRLVDQAGQARREAQERTSQKARERAEQHRRQLATLSKGLSNLRKAIAESLVCWAVFLAWAALNLQGGALYFIAGAVAAASAATWHWRFVVEKWNPAWDADRGSLDAPANRLRIVLVIVVFVSAISLGLLLISTFGKVPFSVSVALSAGLLYFGFASPYLARYHLGI